jgi:hypothetical protein
LKNNRRSFDFVYRKNAANSAQDDKSIYYTNIGDRTPVVVSSPSFVTGRGFAVPQDGRIAGLY